MIETPPVAALTARMSPDGLPQLLANVERLLCDVVRDLGTRLAMCGYGHRKGAEDFVTELDVRAHQWICAALSDMTSGVPIDSEEGSGTETEASTYWVLDPVDGSQNVAVGLPLAGVALCLVDGGHVTLSAVATLWPGRVLAACDNVPPRLTVVDAGGGDRDVTEDASVSDEPLSRVSLIRGSSRLTPEFMRVQHVLTCMFERVYQTRCPVVDLFLLMDGGCRAFVCMDLTGHETLPVLDLASRLGLAAHAASPEVTPPWGVSARLVVARADDVQSILQVLDW